MCLILDRLPTAVPPTPVAHRRAALAPHQPWGPTRQQIRPPPRPVAVLQAAKAQPSQTAHQAVPHRLQDRPVHRVLRKLCQPRFQADHPHHLWQIAPWKVRQILRDQAGHALTRSQYQKQTNAAKQRATVLKRVAQLDINQLPLPEPGEPQPGPSGESNGAIIVFKASRETVQQHPVTKRNHHHHPEERSPMDQRDSETMKISPFRRKRGRNTHTNCKKPNSVLK